MREINQAGISLIKTFEGFKPNVYLDLVGIATCGYGHVVRSGENFSGGLTEQQAEELLFRDLQTAVRSVLRLITVPLTDNQFAALVSFVFNLGGGKLQVSTLRKKVNRNAPFNEIYDEFIKWSFAGGKKSKGLLRRRIAEAQLFGLS